MSKNYPQSSYREDWNLPTNRADYVITHPVTKLARLHSDEKMIAPVWAKVSKTAWQDRANLCGGYGVNMQSTRISVDAPKCFLDPYQTAKKCGMSDSNGNSRSRESFCRTLAKGSKYPSPYESSYVLPGGSSMLEAAMKSKEINSRSTYRLYSGGKFGYLDNKPKPREKPPPIAWESLSAPTTARESIQRSRKSK